VSELLKDPVKYFGHLQRKNLSDNPKSVTYNHNTALIRCIGLPSACTYIAQV